jgi:hypothetical protein
VRAAAASYHNLSLERRLCGTKNRVALLLLVLSPPGEDGAVA